MTRVILTRISSARSISTTHTYPYTPPTPATQKLDEYRQSQEFKDYEALCRDEKIKVRFVNCLYLAMSFIRFVLAWHVLHILCMYFIHPYIGIDLHLCPLYLHVLNYIYHTYPQLEISFISSLATFVTHVLSLICPSCPMIEIYIHDITLMPFT